MLTLPTTGLTNETYFLIANDDPASGFNIDVSDGTSTLVTLGLGGAANYANFYYTGTNWRTLI